MTGLRADRRDHVLRLPRRVLGHDRQRDRQDALHDRRPDRAAAGRSAPPTARASRFGAQHSQSVENWAMAIPGLKVVAPSTPADVKGLLAAAVRDPDPVLFFEHKGLFATKGEVPDGEHVEPARHREGAAPGHRRHDRRAGRDGAARAWRPPSALERDHGISATVVDVRSLVPLDTQTILARGRPGPAGCTPSRRTRGCAAGAPRSRRSSPRSASTTSTGRSSGSPRRTCRCPRPTRSRITPCRRSTRIVDDRAKDRGLMDVMMPQLGRDRARRHDLGLAQEGRATRSGPTSRCSRSRPTRSRWTSRRPPPAC